MNSAGPPGREWTRRAERGSPLLVRFFVWLALSTGRPAVRGLLHPICLYFLLFAPVARRSSRAYLGRIFARPARLPEIYRHLHVFAATLLDSVFFLDDRFELFEIEFQGLEILESALDSGDGVLLLGAHFGSFNAMRAVATTRPDLPLRVLMHGGPNNRVTRIIQAIKPALGKTVIPLDGVNSMLRAHEWLKQGGVVGILGDRITWGNKTLHTPFLGSSASFPTSPWRLAAGSGAAVMMFAAVYCGGNRYRIKFHPVPQAAARVYGRSGAEYLPQIRGYAEKLQEWAREHPYNWFNFHDFWA